MGHEIPLGPTHAPDLLHAMLHSLGHRAQAGRAPFSSPAPKLPQATRVKPICSVNSLADQAAIFPLAVPAIIVALGKDALPRLPSAHDMLSLSCIAICAAAGVSGVAWSMMSNKESNGAEAAPEPTQPGAQCM